MPFRSTLLICIPNIDFSVGNQRIHSWGFLGSKARCDFGVDLFFEHDPTRTSDLNGSTWQSSEFLIVGPHRHLYAELNIIFVLSTSLLTASLLLLYDRYIGAGRPSQLMEIIWIFSFGLFPCKSLCLGFKAGNAFCFVCPILPLNLFLIAQSVLVLWCIMALSGWHRVVSMFVL